MNRKTGEEEVKCRKMVAVNSLCLVPYGSFNSCVCTNFPDDQPCDTETRTEHAETMNCFSGKKNVINHWGMHSSFFLGGSSLRMNCAC